MANEISVYRGDTKSITVTVREAGALKNLTDYTMKLTVKEDDAVADTSALLQSTAVISAPTSGVGLFSLTTTNTAITPGTYLYDVQINKTTTDVKTLFVSTFTVLQDVTKDVS